MRADRCRARSTASGSGSRTRSRRLQQYQQIGTVLLPGAFIRAPIFMPGRIEQQIGQDRADIEADRPIIGEFRIDHFG